MCVLLFEESGSKKKKKKIQSKKNKVQHIVIMDSDEDDDDDEGGFESDRDSENLDDREHLSILDDDVEDEKDDIRVVRSRKRKINDEEEYLDEVCTYSDVEEEIEYGMENEYDGEDEHEHDKKRKVKSKVPKFKKTIPCRGNKTLRGNLHPSKRPLGDLCASLMAHTPCGPDVPDGTKRNCWQHGRCEKHFPRVPNQETDGSTDGYPLYRRRDLLDANDPHEMPKRFKFLEKKKVKITNPFIPAFNAPMMLRYRLHENVEGTHGMSSMVNQIL